MEWNGNFQVTQKMSKAMHICKTSLQSSAHKFLNFLLQCQVLSLIGTLKCSPALFHCSRHASVFCNSSILTLSNMFKSTSKHFQALEQNENGHTLLYYWYSPKWIINTKAALQKVKADQLTQKLVNIRWAYTAVNINLTFRRAGFHNICIGQFINRKERVLLLINNIKEKSFEKNKNVPKQRPWSSLLILSHAEY